MRNFFLIFFSGVLAALCLAVYLNSSSAENVVEGPIPTDLTSQPITQDNFKEMLQPETPTVPAAAGTQANSAAPTDPASPPPPDVPAVTAHNRFVDQIVKPLQINIDAAATTAIQKGQGQEMFKDASDLTRELVKCLKSDDNCKGSDGAEYTPYHRDLVRSLNAMISLGEKDGHLLASVDHQVLVDAIKIPQEDSWPNSIALLSTELLMMTQPTAEVFSEMVDSAKAVAGRSRANFYNVLANTDFVNSGTGRTIYLDSIRLALENTDDRKTAKEVLKSMPNFDLNNHEFKLLLSSACSLKIGLQSEGEWIEISRYINRQLDERHLSFRASKICN